MLLMLVDAERESKCTLYYHSEKVATWTQISFSALRKVCVLVVEAIGIPDRAVCLWCDKCGVWRINSITIIVISNRVSCPIFLGCLYRCGYLVKQLPLCSSTLVPKIFELDAGTKTYAAKINISNQHSKGI
ncbi:hypothetical protein MRB53_029907 [Persea americana]|uniref:Uncharacterized protein n=1 Tax=Persea americana TaxID=3435 RepID=A0ACC2KK22_PERAE|nr:hypothetical protein MRB53_029907 [Persea americana]